MGTAIQVMTGNTTALFYLSKQGGTHLLPLLYLTIQLWEWCLEHHIFPIAIHITSQDSYVADALSRTRTHMHKWSLDQKVFFDLCKLWGTPNIDIFTTPQNTKCPLYCSRAGISPSSLGDALMFPWTDWFI